MVQDISQMYITGPDVIKPVTGEEVTHEELGGASTHAIKSGVAHFVFETEEECLDQIRQLLGFLPSNNMEDPPMIPSFDEPTRTDEALAHIVPDDIVKGYDMREIINRIVDDTDFFESAILLVVEK